MNPRILKLPYGASIDTLSRRANRGGRKGRAPTRRLLRMAAEAFARSSRLLNSVSHDIVALRDDLARENAALETELEKP